MSASILLSRFLNRQVLYYNLAIDFVLIGLDIQIIPEATTVAEPENAVQLDTSIAPVLAESPLEEDDEVFIYPGYVMESTPADDSEIFIYPGFVPDVDGEHEQADDTDIFVYPGNSHTNDEDKDDSDCEVFIYPGTIDIDSAEPAVSNDVFGEVKVINMDSDSAISYVPVSHFIAEFVSTLLTIDR